MDPWQIAGYVATALSVSSFIPQLLKVWRARDASGVSLRMYVITCAAFALWAVHGAGIGAWVLVASSVASFVLAAAILAGTWRARE